MALNMVGHEDDLDQLLRYRPPPGADGPSLLQRARAESRAAEVADDPVRAQPRQSGRSPARPVRAADVAPPDRSRLEGDHAAVAPTAGVDRLCHGPLSTPALPGAAQEGRRRALREQSYRLEQNRTRHLRLALDLLTDARAAEPLIVKARSRVALWREKATCSPVYIDGWSAVLALPPPELAKAMGTFGEWEDAMFQNAPWSWVWS